MSGREWDMDVEVARNLNHVQRELTVHSSILSANAESMKNLSSRSDERLDYLRERFDGIENNLSVINAVIGNESSKIRMERNRILLLATSLFSAICTAVWFAVVMPLQTEIATLREKVDVIEKRIDWDHSHDPVE